MSKNAILLLLAGLLFFSFLPGVPAAVAFEEKSFTLASDFGSQESLEFQVRRPGTIHLAAKWSGAPSSLALILNGPGKVAAYDRKDGGSLLKLEYQVTQTDVLSGGTWTASIHNYSERGPVSGTLRAIVSSGPAFNYDFLGDYPGDREPGWSEECAACDLGDFDCDGVQRRRDFRYLYSCYTGPCVQEPCQLPLEVPVIPIIVCCPLADYDADSAVDLRDFASFQNDYDQL